MLKLIFATIVLAFGWAASIVLEVPLWIPAAVTGALLAVVAAVVLLRRRKSHSAARDIERALRDQAAEQARGVRPDEQDDILAMQNEFAKAIHALKSSRLARIGKDALAVLPWYMIIGPPGAGKSTALRNSGLQFPYLSARRGGVRGVGGTRNCDWWLTNQGIILDTAGRYTTELDDQDEWLSFLDTLKRTRPRRPINGVLVAVSVAELGGADEQDIIELAKRIRERLDEVTARLQVMVPVYVLFTKCDLLPGFVETFSDLKKNERGQIWGFTLPLAQGADAAEEFLQGFDELAGVLEARSVKRLGEERTLDIREQIYEFPQQFEVLRTNLADFVGQLFAANVYQETPVMRGVYFTSGTQEGRPIDRVMEKIGQAFGIGARAHRGEASVEARSYFLRDVFGEVVFPDRNAAVASAQERRRQLLFRLAAGGIAVGAAVLLSLLPAVSYFKNRDLVRSSLTVVEALVAAAPTNPDGPLADEHFEPAAPSLQALSRVAVHGPRASMRFGMYRGDTVLPLVATAVRTTLVLPLIEAFERGQDRSYEALRLYLLLTTPKTADEPERGETEWRPARAWIAAQVKQHWTRRSAAGLTVPSEQFIENAARLYVAVAEHEPKLFARRSPEIVQAARAALRGATGKGGALSELLGELDCARHNIGLAQLVGPAATWFKGDPIMPGAFTRRCWEEQLRSRFGATAQKSGETWVISNAGPSASEAELAVMRSAYFRRYIDEWKKFLRAIRIEAQPDMLKGAAMLTALTDKPRPFGLVMSAVNDNVRLKESSPEEASRWKRFKAFARERIPARAGKALDAASAAGARNDAAGAELYGPEDVEREFSALVRFGIAAPAPAGTEAAKPLLEAYHTELERLLQATELYQQDKEYEKLKALLQTVKTQVVAWISRSKQDGWDLVLDAWLMPPLHALDIALQGDHGGGANQSWCEAVVLPFQELTKGRYPFGDGKSEAELPQVLQFFQPEKGTLWAHYNNFLKKAIVRVGRNYRLAPGEAARTYRPEVLTFLDRAQDLTDFLYAGGGAQPGINLEVRIKPAEGISKTVLEIDGQTIVYRNEPERWVTLRWPGEKKKGASLRVLGAKSEETIPEDGEWGLFHLLDRAVVSRESDYLKIFWRFQTTRVDVRVDLRPARIHQLFRGLTLPRSVAQGATMCGR